MWVSMPELEDILGRDMARALARYQGGIRFYVPKGAYASHSLAKIIGLRGMEILCNEFRGQYITLPNGRREPQKERILKLLAEGETQASIALTCGVTEVYVYKVGKLAPRQEQLTLM